MTVIGVGLIGYGLAGRAFHAPYVRATPGMALRAVVSRDRAKVHADLPDVRVVADVAALMAEPGIDLVVVASPDDLHAEHALAALAAGRHVVVDKPFAASLADARRVAAAAAASGRMLTVFHNRRWDADFRTLQRLVADDVLGEIVAFESRFDRWRPVPAAVWKEARAGGIWQDLGPHLVDQALQLFGPPHGITADLATLRPDASAPDYAHVTLRYPGRRAILHASKTAADNGLRFAVHGRRGSWTKRGVDVQEADAVAGRSPAADDWGIDPVPGILTLPGSGAPPGPVANARGDYRLFWHQLARAIRGEAPNPVPAADGLAVMEIIAAGIDSAATGREVILDRG